jgi:hypothetical protein
MFSEQEIGVLREEFKSGGIEKYRNTLRRMILKNGKALDNLLDFPVNSYRIQLKSKLDFDDPKVAKLYEKNLNVGPFNLYKRPGYSNLVKNTFENIFGYQDYEIDPEGISQKFDVVCDNYMSNPINNGLPVDINQNMNEVLFAYPFMFLVGSEFSRYELKRLLDSDLVEVVKIISNLTIVSQVEKEVTFNSGDIKNTPLLSAVTLGDITQVVDVTPNVRQAFKENKLLQINIADYNEQSIVRPEHFLVD